jgi:ABC-2 type transport system permease protein
MKLLRDIALLYKRKVLETVRNPIYIINSLLTPIIYLLLFSPLLKKLTNVPGFTSGNVLDVFIPGLLVIIAFLNGLFVGYGIIDEVRNGVIERFCVTPTSRFALLAGNVLRDLTNVMVIIILFTVIAIPFGFDVHLLGFLILLVLVALLIITTASFGYALGLILQDEDRLSPIVQGINLPILLLSGMILPMTLAPNWLLFIAHFNPVFYVVEASRLLCAGHILATQVGEAFLVMIPLTIGLVYWATKAYTKVVA